MFILLFKVAYVLCCFIEFANLVCVGYQFKESFYSTVRYCKLHYMYEFCCNPFGTKTFENKQKKDKIWIFLCSSSVVQKQETNRRKGIHKLTLRGQMSRLKGAKVRLCKLIQVQMSDLEGANVHLFASVNLGANALEANVLLPHQPLY